MFVKDILLAKIKYNQKKRKAITFLMGTHDRVGKDSSILKFVNSRMFEPNLIKYIFKFAGGLYPFQPQYV